MSDVFVSHSSKDKEIADKLVEFLEGRGLTCWIAPRNIVAGSDWAASISTAVTASKVFLLIYSANSSASEQVARELGLAETEKDVFVVPYKADNTELTGSFKYYLTSAHWVSADVHKKNYNLEELYSMIAGITGKSVQNITNNTYIDELHIHNDGTPAKKDKKPLIIAACGGGAALVAVIAIIAVIAGGSGNNNPPAQNDQTSQTLQAAQTTASSQAEGDITVSLWGRDYTGSFNGYLNATGQLDGKGEFKGTSASGDTAVYDGEMAKGEATGEGTLTVKFSNGGKNVYKGTFSNGKITGTGEERFDYVDGEYESYNGEFADGYRSGTGTLTKMTKNPAKMETYEGSFDKGEYSGNGKLTLSYTSGEITLEEYEGDFAGGVYNGTGKRTIKWADGENSEYEGEFANGKREGKGKNKYTDSDGNINIYEGDYVNDSAEGEGKCRVTYAAPSEASDNIYITFETFEGSFENNLYVSGDYEYELSNGDIYSYSGSISDGAFNGYGVWTAIYNVTDPSPSEIVKSVHEGEWLNGVANGHGKQIFYYGDGSSETQEGEWVNGELVSQ